jgi:hypothetical protein
MSNAATPNSADLTSQWSATVGLKRNGDRQQVSPTTFRTVLEGQLKVQVSEQRQIQFDAKRELLWQIRKMNSGVRSRLVCDSLEGFAFSRTHTFLAQRWI